MGAQSAKGRQSRAGHPRNSTAADPQCRLTIGQVISSLGIEGWHDRRGRVRYELFSWPPDVFAIAATILKDSGAYLQAARPHPYGKASPYAMSHWQKRIKKTAKAWQLLDSARDPPPAEVCRLLDTVRDHVRQGLLLHELSSPVQDNFDWMPYLELLCIADEASAGIGIYFLGDSAAGTSPRRRKGRSRAFPKDPSFVCELAMVELAKSMKRRFPPRHDSGAPILEDFAPITLCRRVDPSRAIVTPKMRTSQRGITIRSFSHHLALINGSDVEPLWIPTSDALLKGTHRGRASYDKLGALGMDHSDLPKQVGPYNLLVFPWPLEIEPSQFKPMSKTLKCLAGRPPEQHQFFSFEHKSVPTEEFRTWIRNLLTNAESLVGPIHGLVMPEMALTRRDFSKYFTDEFQLDLEFVASGVYEKASDDSTLGKNYAVVRRKESDERGSRWQTYEQEKHHRWALDPGQIDMYSLGSSLRPTTTWWEGITVSRRSLHFFALDALAAFTVLICEDLARPDPVADSVRAVGPNLVICLLMDGPQLVSRWSSRYATVLADDPGSSVLTVSSLGMVRLSKTRDKLHEESRVVGLWRESGGAPTELHLPKGKQALVLSLTGSGTTEYTIDGRRDSGTAGILRLAGVHAITWDKAAANA